MSTAQSTSPVRENMHVADSGRAQAIMRFCMWMTFIYAAVFGASAIYLQSAVLGYIAVTTLMAGFGYEAGRRITRAGKVRTGIFVFGSSIFVTLWIITLLLPEQSTTIVIGSFIPFAISLHFSSAGLPRLFAVLAVLTATGALLLRNLGWSSGFPPYIMAWLDVAGGLVAFLALAVLF